MNVLLAPMEGVVDFNMRRILTGIGGFSRCVTEFIRITEHPLPSRVFYKHCPELHQHCNTSAQVPVSIQLLGSNPEAMAANAEIAANLGAKIVDLNFGCPAKTVNNSDGGAKLLNSPERLYRIVQKVKQRLPEGTKLTAKMRLGYEHRLGYLENALAIEAAGAEELCIHARSKTDAYKPPAYWELVKEVRKQLSINVVINGEIWNLSDWQTAKEQSGCEDAMIGRGILAQPDLAKQIQDFQRGIKPAPLSWEEIAKFVHEYFLDTTECYPKKYLGNRLKQWLSYLKLNYHQAEILLEDIKRSRDFEFINLHLKKQYDAEQSLKSICL